MRFTAQLLLRKRRVFSSVLLFFFLSVFSLFHATHAHADSSMPDSDGDGYPDWVENAVAAQCPVFDPLNRKTFYAVWTEPQRMTPSFGETTRPYTLKAAAHTCSNAIYPVATNARIIIDSAHSRLGIPAGTEFFFGDVWRGTWSVIQSRSGSVNLVGLPSNTTTSLSANYHGQAVHSGVFQQSVVSPLPIPLDIAMPPAPTPTPQATQTPIPTSTPTPIPTFSITGSHFEDLNTDEMLTIGTETPYPTSPSVSVSSRPAGSPLPSIQNNTDGTFRISNLHSGNYILVYGGRPTGYLMNYPVGTPPQLLVQVGTQCSALDTSHGASCSGGNIQNINFSFYRSFPWLQTYGGDVRIDGGIENRIPSSPSCSQNYSVKTHLTPGIVFSGEGHYNFGFGSASEKGWIVGGASYPEIFTSQRYRLLQTSYDAVLANSNRQRITPTRLTTHPLCSNLQACTIGSSISTNTVYTTDDADSSTNDSLILKDFTIAAGGKKQVVFLINGNLTIETPIDVPLGSSVSFIVKGDIIVSETVGTSTFSCPPPGILEALFSTDRSFLILSDPSRDCSTNTPDRMLGIEGSVVVNAAYTGGTFDNRRNLCSSNLLYPSVTLKERPDMLLNLPPALFTPGTSVWQEIAP